MNPIATTANWSYVLNEPIAILIVDDDPILREFASVHMSTPTARVETAANGEIAFRLLKDIRFDVVLVDIEMPVLDGFSLLQKIRSDADLCHLPVIMLTGHDDVVSIDRSYQLGATAFATKPVNWRQLSYEVRYVLRASRMEQDLRLAYDRATEKELRSRGTLQSLQQECRDNLKSILRCIDECRAAADAAPVATKSRIEQIESLTRTLLAYCDAMPSEPATLVVDSPPLALVEGS
jgi:two-component system, sensor histidine kinase and response regulator